MGTPRKTKSRLRFAAWAIALTSVHCHAEPTQSPPSDAAPEEESEDGSAEDARAEAPDSASAQLMDTMDGDISFDAEHDRRPDSVSPR